MLLHAINLCVQILNSMLGLQEVQGLGASLLDLFKGKTGSIQTAGSCMPAPGSSETALEALQRLSSSTAASPKVLLVCQDSAGSLSEELASLDEYSAAFQKTFESHIVAYVSCTSSKVTC